MMLLVQASQSSLPFPFGQQGQDFRQGDRHASVLSMEGIAIARQHTTCYQP